MSHYRALLLDISQHLTAEDLTSLKYLCKEIIPAGRAERITSALEFFSELERRKLLSDENRHFLASMLNTIKRDGLGNRLLEIQAEQRPFPNLNDMHSVLPNFPPHCDPRKQTESGSTVPPYQPWTSSNPSLPLFSPPPNVTSGLDLSNQRLPPFSNPQATRGGWISGHPDPTGLPSQSTAPIYQGAIYADPNHPYYRPFSPGNGQNPLSHSSTTAVPSVSASQRPLVPQTVGNVEPQQIIIASGYSNPSLVIPSASGAGQLSRSSDAIYQRSQSDSTLVNPSSPHHVQKSQPSIDQYVSYPGPLPQGTMVNPSPQSSPPAVPSESASQGASVTPNVGNEVLQAPTAASGFSNPPPFVSTAGVAGQHNPNDASNQRLQTDSTLTDPSPGHPVKISQLSIENPSLQSQPSAAPSGSEIASLTDHTSTDAATQELPGSTSRQVKKHPALEGSAGLDTVDHPPNGSMHKFL